MNVSLRSSTCRDARPRVGAANDRAIAHGLPAGLLWPLLGLAILNALVAPTHSRAQDFPGGFPSIACEPAEIDFGRIEQNQVREAEITIRNEGAAELKIGNVSTTCGCTVAEPESKILAPGAATKLKVTFSSQKFQGPQTKRIGITSNDPATPFVEVIVRADVHAPIYVEPLIRQLAFGSHRPGEHLPQTARFWTDEVPSLQVRPVKYSQAHFQIEVDSQPGSPATAVATVRVRPDAPHGMIREVIRFETNIPGVPSVDLEAFGSIVKGLQVHPEQVNFRYVERDQQLRYEVVVTSAVARARFKVTGAEIDLPNFEARIEERTASQQFAVILSGKPLPVSDERAVAAQGRMQGTLRIFTDSPEQPEIPVKVTYLLKM